MQTVLVVDDDRAFHLLMQRALKSLDLQIVSAFDADEGLRLATKLKPAIIVVDIYLPGKDLDGWTITEAIKMDEQLKHIPVIVVSAAGISADFREKVHRYGGDLFFQKPFDLNMLVDCLRQYIE